MYSWEGMRKMNIKEVLKRYSDNTLVGCFYLYRDGSEGMIEKDVSIDEYY